jgi:hypothetical protein
LGRGQHPDRQATGLGLVKFTCRPPGFLNGIGNLGGIKSFKTLIAFPDSGKKLVRSSCWLGSLFGHSFLLFSQGKKLWFDSLVKNTHRAGIEPGIY